MRVQFLKFVGIFADLQLEWSNLPGMNSQIILNAGAGNLKESVPPGLLPNAKESFNTALVDSWYIVVALLAGAVVGSCMLERYVPISQDLV